MVRNKMIPKARRLRKDIIEYYHMLIFIFLRPAKMVVGD